LSSRASLKSPTVNGLVSTLTHVLSVTIRGELCRRAERNCRVRVEGQFVCRGFQYVAIGSCGVGSALGGCFANACECSNPNTQFLRTLRFLSGLTAAHRTLPFGTHVRVTDPKTRRSVVVVINDRGPFGKRRVLDLSPSAARALGMISRGVIYVQAEVL